MPVITLKVNCLNPPVKRERLVEWMKEMMYLYAAAAAKPLQSCPTLRNPMDCSLPASSVHGILQGRILEQVAIPFSRGSSQPRTESISPA